MNLSGPDPTPTPATRTTRNVEVFAALDAGTGHAADDARVAVRLDLPEQHPLTLRQATHAAAAGLTAALACSLDPAPEENTPTEAPC